MFDFCAQVGMTWFPNRELGPESSGVSLEESHQSSVPVIGQSPTIQIRKHSAKNDVYDSHKGGKLQSSDLPIMPADLFAHKSHKQQEL